MTSKGDIISREFLQTAIHNFFNGLNHTPTEEDIQRYIEVAPSVENKGEWIEVIEKRFPNGEKQMWRYECSVCSTGEPPCPINKEHWDFCPNCGADMRKAVSE